MPFAWVGAAASLGSLAGGISSMTSGNGQNGTAYVPQNQAGADNYYYGALGGLNSNAGYGNTLAGQIMNNPYAGQAQTGAGVAGCYMTGTLAPELEGASRSLYGTANAGLPYAKSILTTAFDPQHALYNQQRNLNNQQTMALEAAQGVSNSPFGAGTTAQSNTNFNLGWQNNQLARQTAGLEAYGGYMGQLGNSYQQAGNLGNAGANAYATGAALPYATYLNQRNAGLGALGQASNLYGNVTSAAGNYMGLGQYGQQAAFNQNQTYGNNIGGALQGLGNFAQNQWGTQVNPMNDGQFQPVNYTPLQDQSNNIMGASNLNWSGWPSG